MRYKEILKRAIPFVATFILGLFVASFFVAISAPKIGFKKYKKSCTERKLRFENNSLREEKRILEMRLNEVQRQMPDGTVQRFEIPAPPPPPRIITPYEGVDRPVLTEQEQELLDRAARESRR